MLKQFGPWEEKKSPSYILMSSYIYIEMHKHLGQEARNEFSTSLLCIASPGRGCCGGVPVWQGAASLRDGRTFVCPDPTYPLKTFLYVEHMAEKKEVRSKLVTFALKRVYIGI